MIDSICVDSKLIGTENNLIIDDGYRWIDSVPVQSWHLSGKIKNESNFCLDTLLKLNFGEFNLTPPEKFVKAMRLVSRDSLTNIPWSHVMPNREHQTFVRKIVNQAKEAIEKFSKDYYLNTWVPESIVLRNLQPAKVSKEKYVRYFGESGNNSKAIEGFKPDNHGYASHISYERFGTRTGRLTVSSGPGILTLKKDYRDVITPTDKDGKIVYIDFAALEARIALYEAGGRCESADLYDHISQELFDGKVPRNSVKIAVISELYGSGRNSLAESLGISGVELDNFIEKVRTYFKINELKQRVKDQFLKLGYITNRHGRRINIDEPVDRIFINSYIQSTGVDVALLGFSEIIKSLAHNKSVRPLFVLHDALILDVPCNYIDKVVEITSVKVPGYVQKFPLRCEIHSLSLKA